MGAGDEREGAAAGNRAAREAAPVREARLEVLLAACADAGERARLCRFAAAGSTDPETEARWRVRLAHALVAAGDAVAAAEACEEALLACPGDAEALRDLLRLHAERGDPGSLLRALERVLVRAVGEEEVPLRIALAERLAALPGRERDAWLQLRRVVELAPERTEVLERAAVLGETAGCADDVVALLERALARGGDAPRRAALLARQATLLAGPLASPARAARCWREALALAPGLPGARDGLRRALEEAGDWAGVLACLHDEAHDAGPEARAALLETAAERAESRLGPGAAFPWLERLRAEAPHDPAIATRIADLHRRAGHTHAWLAAVERALALDPDPETKRRLERERADALPGAGARRRAQGTPDGPDLAGVAAPPCGPKSEPDPPTAPLRHQIVSLVGARAYAAEPDAETAAAELARLDPTAPVLAERRRALLARVAAAGLERGADEATYAALRALADDPEATEAERAWSDERLVAALPRDAQGDAERAQRLARVLARRPDDGPRWVELGTLRLDVLDEPELAAAAFRDALARMPASREALHGLRRAAEAQRDFTTVAWTLERELSLAPREAHAGLLRQLGLVAWRRLGATTRASRAFAAALEADPRDRVSLRALQQLLIAMEDWRGALDLHESELELLAPDESPARRALWLRIADLAEERTDEPERAVRALDAAHAIAPLDAPARARLAALLERSGDLGRWVAIVRELLDAPDAAPDPDTELQLARALLGLGRADEARARVKRALAAGGPAEPAWSLLAEVEQARGEPGDAAECLRRAALAAPPARAVAQLLQAATLVEREDPELAHALCVRACDRDPGSAAAHGARARVAHALGRAAEAGAATALALELILAGGDPIDSPMEALALAVAAGARRAGDLATAARILEALRCLRPDSAATLRADADVRHALGDLEAAGRALERLALVAGTGALDAGAHAIRGAALVRLGDGEGAAAAFAAALALDPILDDAWEGLVALHERAGRELEAAACLERWADISAPWEAAPRWLRAGLLSARHPCAADPTERRLRAALALDPGEARAWRTLAGVMLAASRTREAARLCEAALRHTLPRDARARLHELRACALERLGEPRAACLALAAAVDHDPEAAEAALGCARLLRREADWAAAAAVLETFLAGVRTAPDGERARAWLELGRLQAGPLGDDTAAARSLRAALLHAPTLREAREELVDLLLRHPEWRQEAIAAQRALLDAEPTRRASLRGLVALARGSGLAALAHEGERILEILSGPEPGRAPQLSLRVATALALENPVWERARQLAMALAPELARALEASQALEPPPGDDGVERFRLAAVVAEAELAVPALVPMSDGEAGAVLSVAAALVCDREVVRGPGPLVNRLAGAIGRAARRRARAVLADTSPEEIAEIDYQAWRVALRSLAHALALDRTGGDLHAALRALVLEAGDDGSVGPDGNLGDAVARTPAARELVRRVGMAWAAALATAMEAP